MSMTQTLAPHLPYLRRYARALTGSQSSGDAHVRAALTALLEGDESLTEGVPPRVALYRLFHAIWQSGAEHYDDATMPPYTLTNAFVGWERGHWRFQFNCNNVFDITYTAVGVARQIMYGGIPRDFQGTVAYTW